MNHRFFVLVGMVLVLLSCGSRYRVDPLLMEPVSVGERITGKYKDKETLSKARETLQEFVSRLRGERCREAWELLTVRYQEACVQASGGKDQAVELFCQGYVLRDQALVQGDWVQEVLGKRPHHVVSAPPEMGVKLPAGESLVFVVQQDGGYVSVVLVKDGGGLRLEPFR